MYMNVICISGRLCHTPALRQTPNGHNVCTVSLGVDRPRVKDQSDFFNVVAWDSTAEYIARAHVGDFVVVNGCLTSRSYTDKNGLKREIVEIKADDITVIRKGSNSTNTEPFYPDENPDVPF